MGCLDAPRCVRAARRERSMRYPGGLVRSRSTGLGTLKVEEAITELGDLVLAARARMLPAPP